MCSFDSNITIYVVDIHDVAYRCKYVNIVEAHIVDWMRILERSGELETLQYRLRTEAVFPVQTILSSSFEYI